MKHWNNISRHVHRTEACYNIQNTQAIIRKALEQSRNINNKGGIE